MDESVYRRRRLRLGALLFRLRYYMQAPDDIAADIYRYGPDTYAQVVGERVRLVHGGREEMVSLEEAIARCKAALDGAPPRDRMDSDTMPLDAGGEESSR